MASRFRASTPPQSPAWKLQPGICKLELIGVAVFTLKTQTKYARRKTACACCRLGANADPTKRRCRQSGQRKLSPHYTGG